MTTRMAIASLARSLFRTVSTICLFSTPRMPSRTGESGRKRLVVEIGLWYVRHQDVSLHRSRI